MLLASLVGLAFRDMETVAGALAWAAGLTLLRGLGRRQLGVVLTLAGTGAVGIVVCTFRGGTADWGLVLSQNQLLISLLVAISFLRLVVSPGAPAPEDGPHPLPGRPRGRTAVWQTIVGVHFLGAVINVSIIEMVGGRIMSSGRSRRGSLLLLSRPVSTAAFWTPFSGATAAALTYAPGARLPIVLAIGGCAAGLALVASGFTIMRALGDDLDEFRGFSFTTETLAVPLTLVVLVLGSHFAMRQVPMPGVIAVCTLVLTVVLLCRRRPHHVLGDLAAHATQRLPQMRAELTLFLAAGLLAAGFTAAMGTFGTWVPFHDFTAWQAYLMLLVMVAASMTGVHPVITIAIAASLLRPLHPDPTLFALTGLYAWGIQGAGGPLSGLNVILHSRFGIDSFLIARWNGRYVVGMLLLAAVLLPVCRVLTGPAG